jgi:hypothetical protein
MDAATSINITKVFFIFFLLSLSSFVNLGAVSRIYAAQQLIGFFRKEIFLDAFIYSEQMKAEERNVSED